MGVTSVVLLLLLVVAATSLAQNKCCSPDQFEALEENVVGSVVSGKGVAFLESIQVAFDYTNKRAGEFASIVAAGETQVYKQQVIVDYKKAVEYVIDPALMTCEINPLQPGIKMPHCVPEDATYMSSYYIGDKKLTADAFSFHMSEGSAVGSAIMSVSKGDCIPLGTTFIGTRAGTPVLEVMKTVNYTSGIKDPSHYFTVPSYCPTSFSNKPKMYNSIFYKILA